MLRFDCLGRLLSTTGSLAVTFGAEQPFRYRGYCLHRQSPDLRTKKRAGNISGHAISIQISAASSRLGASESDYVSLELKRPLGK